MDYLESFEDSSHFSRAGFTESMRLRVSSEYQIMSAVSVTVFGLDFEFDGVFPVSLVASFGVDAQI